MVLALILSIISSFVTGFFVAPQLMKFLYAVGVVGLDLNKPNKPLLPSSGGICVAAGVIAGLLTYVGIKTFVYHEQNLNLLAVVSSALIVAFVGLIDDLNVRSKKVKTNEGYDIRIGVSRWIKPLLTLPAAVPLMAISAGETVLALPFIGPVNFGILYPLLLVPIGMVGASNMINMLGGHNGLEAGMGLVYMSALGLYALLFGSVGSVIFLITTGALLAFLFYNWYPSKILPGDSLTYLLGALLVSGLVVGNLEKIGIMVMTPFFIQGLLKFYSRYKLGRYASDLGKVNRNGIIKPKYDHGIFSLTHLVMKIGNFTEKQIVIILILIQAAFGIMPFFAPALGIL